MNAIAANIGDRQDLIIHVAEMAGALRGARHAGAAEPVLCLLDCDPHHWRAWGPADICTNCGTRPLSASSWHGLLTTALRSTVAPELRVAA